MLIQQRKRKREDGEGKRKKKIFTIGNDSLYYSLIPFYGNMQCTWESTKWAKSTKIKLLPFFLPPLIDIIINYSMDIEFVLVETSSLLLILENFCADLSVLFTSQSGTITLYSKSFVNIMHIPASEDENGIQKFLRKNITEFITKTSLRECHCLILRE
jgi:hypothetical protein